MHDTETTLASGLMAARLDIVAQATGLASGSGIRQRADQRRMAGRLAC
jgi:hypothetical protein